VKSIPIPFKSIQLIIVIQVENPLVEFYLVFIYSDLSIELATIPEINLALIIGPIKSALGLHPWLTRLTEFM